MATRNQIDLALSGSTGTGSFVGSTSPALVRPTSGNFISGYSTTATAATTTTLTVASNYQQFFTGSTTQTVVMPVTSTLTVGQSWWIVNNSSGIVTVQSSGANNIIALAGGTDSVVTCIAQAGTTAADWNAESTSGVAGVDSITGTSNQIIASNPAGAVTLSLPQSIATTSAVTFGSVTFSPTTQGIVGTTTNDNASAGYVGEYISSTILNGGVTISLSNNNSANVVSITLSAGDWDVWGSANFLYGASTNVVDTQAGINTTTATLPDKSLQSSFPYNLATGAVPVNNLGLVVPQQRLSVSGSTIVYLVVQVNFAVSTCNAAGFIAARRIR